MCGIAGVIGKYEGDPGLLDSARDLMSHRGPDDAGSFLEPGLWLASRRLAILGLGPFGHQPLQDSVTNAVIVFNGEIYNYRELRQELETLGYPFVGLCDTEVLLRAYLHWGLNCVDHLNGMWSMAIWDPRERFLHISRDRFGVKPLFWTRCRGATAFASEPKVLLRLFPELRRPDESSIVELLAFKRVFSGTRSFYDGVDVFPAATWASIPISDPQAAEVKHYWRFPAELSERDVTQHEAYSEFDRLLDDSVRLRLRSEVPVGVTLSGGLDSTAVLHSARLALSQSEPLVAYTSIYTADDESMHADERVWAAEAVSHYADVDLRQVPVRQDDWLQTLRKIVWHMDGPGFSPAVVPLWHIAERAHADGIKVLLEGQGADESLGGYSWHLAESFIDGVMLAARQGGWRDVWETRVLLQRGFSQFARARFIGDIVGGLSLRAREWDRRRRTVSRVLNSCVGTDISRASQRERRLTSGRMRASLIEDFTRDLLPGFLHYGDAIMMGGSVENRLPFMDYRLVEHMFSMPSVYKAVDGESKAPLRAYLRNAGQHAIASRMKKQGYPTPANEWLAARNGHALRSVLGPAALVNEYIDRSKLSSAIARHASGNFAAGDALFGLFCTELWLEECVS